MILPWHLTKRVQQHLSNKHATPSLENPCRKIVASISNKQDGSFHDNVSYPCSEIGIRQDVCEKPALLYECDIIGWSQTSCHIPITKTRITNLPLSPTSMLNNDEHNAFKVQDSCSRDQRKHHLSDYSGGWMGYSNKEYAIEIFQRVCQFEV